MTLLPRILLPAVMFAGATLADDASWALEKSIDPATYQQVTTLSLEAHSSISDEYGASEVTPRLVWLCEAGGDGVTQVRIDWQRFISSFNTALTFVADGKDELVMTFGVDRSNKVTLTKSASDAMSLLRYVGGRHELSVTVTPYSDVPVTVIFDITGLEAGLERLADTCAN